MAWLESPADDLPFLALICDAIYDQKMQFTFLRLIHTSCVWQVRLRQKCAVWKNRKNAISVEMQPSATAANIKHSLCESTFRKLTFCIEHCIGNGRNSDQYLIPLWDTFIRVTKVWNETGFSFIKSPAIWIMQKKYLLQTVRPNWEILKVLVDKLSFKISPNV